MLHDGMVAVSPITDGISFLAKIGAAHVETPAETVCHDPATDTTLF